jgi:2-polyprenyl-6-hydroxyphenyl methylase/3-demethylubiquinone-9 3-methyltransferase
MAAIEKDSVKKDEQMRFEFGKNWSKFVRSKFNQERCDVSKKWMLDFSRRQSFEGTDFLDIGCGSGLNSLAAWQAGAVRVHSFDYDPNSVAATKVLWEYAGRPSNWKVEQGDALNADYIRSLGRWNFVYSWGVLHHTGRGRAIGLRAALQQLDKSREAQAPLVRRCGSRARTC